MHAVAESNIEKLLRM